MNLLLDTHIAIWAVGDNPRLGNAARTLISDPDNGIWVSAVALLEIAVKRTRSPSSLPLSAKEAKRLFEAAGYRLLSISAAHAAAVETLPPIHGDPFDRLLVAQALHEPLVLLTRDRRVAEYSDSIILV